MRIYLVVLICLVVKYTAYSAPYSEHEKSIRSVFNEYFNGMHHGHGESIVSLISTDSLVMYDKYAELAILADKEKLLAENIVTITKVIKFRFLIPSNKISTMNGKDLFVFAANNKHQQTAVLIPVIPKIKSINVSRESAVATYTKNDSSSSLPMYFLIEEGIWKIHLTPFLDKASSFLEIQRVSNKFSKDKFAFHLLSGEKQLNFRPDKTLWLPASDHSLIKP
ncbi:MAG: hypothetical protein HQL32_02665 [Planctomycetes bacterium]|nr:hypothetical protein [Planctomycetota bacterium]